MSVKAIEADDGYIDSAKIYTIAPKKQYTNTNNNTYTNKNILRIPCSKFLGYASCEPYITVDKTDSLAAPLTSREISSGKYLVSDDKKRMSWHLANKTCEKKGLRLPNASELHAMYLASQQGLIAPFVQHEYWADGSDVIKVYHNCYMGAGNCGRDSYKRFNYVRCVRK